jgi:hypothetical protein
MDPVKTTEAAAEIAKAAKWGEVLERYADWTATASLDEWREDGKTELEAVQASAFEEDAAADALSRWTLAERRIVKLIQKELDECAAMIEPHNHLVAKALRMNEPERTDFYEEQP